MSALAVFFSGVLGGSALATFPGQNGKIAFVETVIEGGVDFSAEIDTVNPDGTGRTRITNDPADDIDPSWSPDGTKIAFATNRDGNFEIYTMNADGTSLARITNHPSQDSQPAWSPDGAKIVFTSNRDGNFEIYTMNADGTSPTRLTSNLGTDAAPAWSPDGTRIAFQRRDADGNWDIYAVNPDGTGETRLTEPPGTDASVSWSPDASRIAFVTDRDGNSEIYTMNADGTSLARVTNHPRDDSQPAWSPDGTRIAFYSDRDPDFPDGGIYTMNADGTNSTLITYTVGLPDMFPDWQPIPINSYPRPEGATPFLTYLVPAYAECTSPNRTHGPSLAFGSCAPPTQTSDELTVGSADSNGKPTKSVSSVRFDTVVGNPATPADEADVAITAQVIDVYTQSGLSDYAGDVTAKAALRITDKLNTPHPGGPGAGTVSDIPYEFTIPCAATPDTTIGGACLLSTSADALTPGAVKEGKRSIWQLGQVEVYDANGALFMRQGIFVP